MILRHNFDILRKFKKRSFLNHADFVAKGYIRRNERALGVHRVVPGVMSIVAAYYVDAEAGIFQLAFHIYALTKKAKINTITSTMLSTLTTKIVGRKSVKGAKSNTANIELYRTELVRLGHLKALKREDNGLESNSSRKKGIGYIVPMERALEFSSFRK